MTKISSKTQFFSMFSGCLVVQFVLTFISYWFSFEVTVNLLLTLFFCWMQDYCLHISYPMSLQYETKEQKTNFFLYLFKKSLKVLPFFALWYVFLLLFIFIKGQLHFIWFVVSSHINHGGMLDAYPFLPYYISVLICYFIIIVYLVKYMWDYNKEIKTFFNSVISKYLLTHKTLKNCNIFYKDIKNSGVNIPLYIYFLISFGIIITTLPLVVLGLVLSAYFTKGLAYICLLIISNITIFILCLPQVNAFLKKKYGIKCLHLIGWNIISSGGRIIARGVGILVFGEAARTTGEVVANTYNDTTHYFGDKIGNKIIFAQRTDYEVTELHKNNGKSLSEIKKEAEILYKLKSTPKSDVQILRWKWPGSGKKNE